MSKTVKVNANGKAPSGLKAGDKVVTGGGTYTISSVNKDGTYNSTKTSNTSTTTYKGSYDNVQRDPIDIPSNNSKNDKNDGSGGNGPGAGQVPGTGKTNTSSKNDKNNPIVGGNATATANGDLKYDYEKSGRESSTGGKTFAVGQDGRAPSNAGVGDFIVTGNGTYRITGKDADGKFTSVKVNDNQTTANYRGYTGQNHAAVLDRDGYLAGWVNGSTARQTGADGQPTDYYTGMYTSDVEFYSGYKGNGQANASLARHIEGALRDGNEALAAEMQRIMESGSSAEKQIMLDRLDQWHNVSSSGNYNTFSPSAYNTSNMNMGGVFATGGGVGNLSYEDALAYSNGFSSYEKYQREQQALENERQGALSGVGSKDYGYKDYDPVDENKYTSQIMSYNDALAMAKSMLEPQYQQRYEQSAKMAAQNLDRAGLHDSMYGQGLMAEAQREIDRDLQAAIQNLAGQLVGQSRDQALALLQMAINENQFGASHDQQNVTNTINYRLKELDMMMQQFNADRDYALAQQAQALKERIQNFSEKQANWQMGGFDSYFDMEKAVMELQLEHNLKLSQANQRSSSGGGGGGGGYSTPGAFNLPGSGFTPGGGSTDGGGAGRTGIGRADVLASRESASGDPTLGVAAAGASTASGKAEGNIQSSRQYQEIYNQANSIRIAEGDVSALYYLNNNCSSMEMFNQLMQELRISNTSYNIWWGQQYEAGYITKEQYQAGVRR